MDLLKIKVCTVIKVGGVCDFIEMNHSNYSQNLGLSNYYSFRNITDDDSQVIKNLKMQ